MFNWFFIPQDVTQELQKSPKMNPQTNPEIIKSMKFVKRESQWKPNCLLWFWGIRPPTFRHLGHQKRMPKLTRRRTFNFRCCFLDLCEFVVPQGRPTNHFFHIFVQLGPFGDPLGGQGSPKDPQGHEINTKFYKNDTKIVQK